MRIRDRYRQRLLDDDFTPPVGFAREPREDRRRLIVRVITVILMLFIAWLFLTRVLRPPSESGPFPRALQPRAPLTSTLS